MPTLIPGF